MEDWTILFIWIFFASYIRKVGEKFPNSVLIDKDVRVLVDRLLDKKILKGKIKYLVKWIGYSNYDDI
jgi:hypothetical protein